MAFGQRRARSSKSPRASSNLENCVRAAILALAAACAPVLAQAHSPKPLEKAYAFLFAMMDKYQKGPQLRFVQSFEPTTSFSNGDVSYTYDDAVMITALLQRGQDEDIRRATLLGDSLLYVQLRDPYGDGRVRSAYHAQKFAKPDGSPNFAQASSDTGNMSWTGMALIQLYHATEKKRYLTGALAVAGFVQENTYDTRGAGGYTGGITAEQKKIAYKSTEHNIDLYGLFTMLAQETGDTSWTADANHALGFIAAMWDSKRHHFYIGTGDDGVTANTSDPTPEDVQTWSFLSTGSAQYRGSIDWALHHLSATSGQFAGLSYEVKDRSGVWFEGTGHAAAALLARDLFGDSATASRLLSDIESGQKYAPNADGNGIDAAS